MAFEQLPEDTSPLDYRLCQYETSRLTYRGPACDLSKPHVAVLGGSETFGRYIEHPYPALLQDWLDMPVANLGVFQAGLSLFSEERWLLEAASQAEVAVLQVLGAQNMSNRLYSVHSRRNDRFLAVSPALRDIFPGVDFSEINFTGHLLSTLAEQSQAAFEVLVEELRWAWIQRMRRIVKTIKTDVVLLWLSDRAPEDPTGPPGEGEPAFVDRAMLDALVPEIAGLVEVVTQDKSADARMKGKLFAEAEREAALAYPGAGQHMRAAELLAVEIERIRNAPDPRQSQVRA